MNIVHRGEMHKEGTLLHFTPAEGEGGSASQALIEIEGVTKPALIVGFAMGDRAAIQVSPSIGGPYYLYSFGQELTNISASFIGFRKSCGTTQSNGLNSLIAFYDRSRVSPDRMEPITMVFSGVTIHAFVVSLSVQGSSGSTKGVFNVTVEMLGWRDPFTQEQQGGPSSSSSQGGQAAQPSRPRITAHPVSFMSLTRADGTTVSRSLIGPPRLVQ